MIETLALVITVATSGAVLTLTYHRILKLERDLMETGFHRDAMLARLESLESANREGPKAVGQRSFTATTAAPISEESIKYAEAKITEELLARGTPASAERVRAHVRDLLGA